MAANIYYKKFIAASVLTAVVAAVILFYSFYLGKIDLFLIFNHDFGKVADYFFYGYTYLGDGIIWIPILFLFIKYRKKYIPFLISVFVLSTLFVQGCKYFIVPNEFRPIKAIANTALIHFVEEPHETSSFPSGHTTTAFCIFLIASLFIPNKWIIPVGFIAALLVGYSRVYLAQHFPLDVAAGMLVAIESVALSIAIQNWWEK
jgi:membrane-associated phospholipid phosphatase